ncbi:ExbD/TolR family protein [Sphingomonas sp. MS122]|uniref:ExbD/TolR family protein n=1 Tax=Sphingomonas sp. MS122 TaxID=3412683 RepID=UPI003C2C3AFC
MRRFTAPPQPEPFSAINTTPLIDVMLVLLIMLIITIPAATHKLPVELPQGPSGPVLDTPHRLDIAANGALAWDGRAIADAELPALLASIVAADGVLHFKADEAARYERFANVLATVKRAGVTRLGFVGNERMAFD